MGFHEQPAHCSSVFGPKAWLPGAGLHPPRRAAPSAGLRQTVGDVLCGYPPGRAGHGSCRCPPPSGARSRLGGPPPVRAEASSAGLRPSARGHGSCRCPPPSGARSRLGGPPPIRVEASSVGLRPARQGSCCRVCADCERLRLSTYAHLRKIVCLISLEIRRPPHVILETPA